MSIGQNIKRYRKEKGYTQRELAELVGVSVQAVSKWETDSGAPDISQVVPLATALEISTDTLLDFQSEFDVSEFERICDAYIPEPPFREQRYSEQNYALIAPYFSSHTRNTKAAAWCLKCLVDLIAAGKTDGKSKEDLLAECEKYANCIFKYETDPDNIFMARFLLARGYSALGNNDKAGQIIRNIPVTFGDRFYWEAEIAQANEEYDSAMVKCRKSFALKARFISRCIRMAGEISEASDTENGLRRRLEYEEYMLRLLNAFLSGGDYLPCRQVYQKYILLTGMVGKYIRVGDIDTALERAEMLFSGREDYIAFLKHPENRKSLLFEDNNPLEYQIETKEKLDNYVQSAVEMLKTAANDSNREKITALLSKYSLD